MNDPLEALQARLGHRFGDASLLDVALTHPSWAQDHPDALGTNNQRLEFLGDSVLQLVLTEALYAAYPSDREGVLTRRRAVLGKGAVLAGLARELRIDACLRVSSSEDATGGRSRDAALEDAFEAVVGAVYMDAGVEVARRVVLAIYGDLAARLSPLEDQANPKGRLQELVQPVHGNGALRYEVVATEGADHSRTYEVAVLLGGKPVGWGRGPSKKVAEEEAARQALTELGSGTTR